jgi:serine/threonine-protein kinase
VSYEEAGIAEGQVLAGKYRIEKILGVGGMGVVVAALHIQLDTKVAIKFLAPRGLRNMDAMARFAREARAAVKITGEHVARVLDVGTLENGAPYMVMEFLEGSDLATLLQQQGALPIDQAVEFVLQAGVAVAEAHALGIVHRDLKPANLFCIRRADGRPFIKVLDFGISKVEGAQSTDGGMVVTKTTAVMGSPLYMSPEQMQAAKGVDLRADIWALGIILYELLTTKVPFEGETVTDVAIKVATQTPASIRSLRGEVDPGLDAAVLKCLQKQKEDRFASVAELALALGDFAPPRARALIERICDILQVSAPASTRVESTSVESARLPPAVHASVPAATMSAVTRTESEFARRKKPVAMFIAAGAGTLGFATVVAVLAFHKARAPRGETVPAAIESGSAAAAIVSPEVSTSTPETSNVALPSLSKEPAATSPSSEPQAETSSQAYASSTPHISRPAGKPAPVKGSAPAASAASSPNPTSAPRPAPTPRKNSLDLGNFQ